MILRDTMKEKKYFPDFANSTPMGHYITNREEEIINLYLGNNHDNKIYLDVGGGSGRFSVPFFKNGADIICLDYNLTTLQILQEKESSIPLTRGDGQKLPFRESVFDAILIIEAIEYMTDKNLFIKECHRVLKDEGLLLITILNRNSYKILHPNRRKRPSFYFTTCRSFEIKLERLGFVIEKSIGFNWIPAKRTSDSKLIPYFAALERLFRLEYLPYISPWVFIIAKKYKRSDALSILQK